ncbi:MAG TPA: hypothetical protein VGM91_12000 [Conexibacter sp.]|jgi:hypothetical protein
MSVVKQPSASALAPSSPRLRARIRALLHPGGLDRRLAAGADPSRDPELAARAALLLKRSTRSQLASGLESAAAAAFDGRIRALSAAVPVDNAAVEEALDDLAALATRLRAPEPVRPQGVAIARQLLTDGAGPLYAVHAPGALAETVRSALHALDDGMIWA